MTARKAVTAPTDRQFHAAFDQIPELIVCAFAAGGENIFQVNAAI